MIPAVIFDIDGTLSDPTHRRHHANNKAWDKFFDLMHQDPPIDPVIKIFHALHAHSNHMLIVSGRPERYTYQTIQWLTKHKIHKWMYRLFMRKDGDRRHDTVIKSEILDEIIHQGFAPWLVVDDREAVVKMWRARGLICLQNEPFEEAPTTEEAIKFFENFNKPGIIGTGNVGPTTLINKEIK